MKLREFIPPKRNFVNLFNGLAVFLVTLPDTVIFGTIVFSSLGSEWIALGIASCFVAHIVARLIAIFCSLNVEIVLAPSSYSALILSSVVVLMMNSSPQVTEQIEKEILSVQTALLIGVVSGLLQLVFYQIKITKIIEFIPYELVSNIVNLTAILIIIMQVPILLFNSHSYEFYDLKQTDINFFTVTIGLFSMLPLVIKRFTKTIPTPLISLFFGMLVYQFLIYLFPTAKIEMLPKLDFTSLQQVSLILNFHSLSFSEYSLNLLLMLFVAAFSLATLNTLSLLIASKQVKGVFDRKSGLRDDLMSNSITNAISPIFAGLPCTGKIGVTEWALRNGSNGRTIAITVAILYFCFLFFAHNFLEILPMCVIAGVAVVVAFELFDKRFLSILKKFAKLQYSVLREDIGFILTLFLMIVATLVSNFFIAFIVGFTVILIEFTVRISKYKIQAESLSNYKARTQRSAYSNDLIHSAFSTGVLVKLDGFLLFPIAEKLRQELETTITDGYKLVILDLTKVHYADTSGIDFLIGKIRRLEEVDINTYLVLPQAAISEQMTEAFKESFNAGLCCKLSFSNLNDLLLKLEDELLREHSDELTILPTENLEIFDGVDKTHRKIILNVMTKVNFKAGEQIPAKSEPHIILIQSGAIDVYADPISDKSKNINQNQILYRFLPGALLGEMSFLDGQKRSAGLKVVEDTECLLLSKSSYNDLKSEQPILALLLMENISKSLSRKLRNTNETLANVG